MLWGSLWRTVYQVVGYLGDCVGLYFVLLLAWTISKGKRPKHARLWMRLATRSRKYRGIARTYRVWETAIALSTSTALIYAMTRPSLYPIAEEHDVAVYGQFPDGDWSMSSKEEGRFAFRPCPGFDVAPMLRQSIGYVAPRARWEERGDCKSIRATGLGFYWKDEHGNYKEIANAGTAR